MKKTGIMGGTFNPIHNGHLALALAALRQYALEEVLFVPCGQPYMKDPLSIAPCGDRVRMTALAISGQPAFRLSTIEADSAGDTYTYQTLERLRRNNPDADYYFIMGADSLFHITEWKCPERIFAACHILAATRDGRTEDDMKEQLQRLERAYHADVRLLQMDTVPVSSTEIRRRIAAGEPVDGELPEAVADYIREKGLYR